MESFLAEGLSFPGIARTIEEVLAQTPASSPGSIPEVMEMDRRARELARTAIAGGATRSLTHRS